ncbi:MAG: BrnT family toxin [Deltaproteobacteria bacterium]|nr:BrnT family toxin [Deltaproteobacteria bacterium]
MKTIHWNTHKNEWLKEHRGISFEQVVICLERGDLFEILDHQNQERYPDQKVAVINIENYAYLVPYIEDEEGIFLKTIIPSRKATEKYLGRRR